jgi:carboxylesterase
MPQIIPTAEPFFFPGGKTGILLVHGFTSAPREMRWMGEYLNAQGHTVLGLRLAGHATRPQDMIRSRWQDWLLSVEDGFSMLRSCTERIFLAGLSLGGVLALTFAGQERAESPRACGIIAMSTPYFQPQDWRLRFLKPLSRIKPFISKGDGGPGAGWFGDAWKQHVAYPQYPLRSVHEMNQLMNVMYTSLPRVDQPVLLICSRNDHPLICASMGRIFQEVASRDKQQLWLEGSGHTVTEEPQRQLVFETAAAFIARVGEFRGGHL